MKKISSVLQAFVIALAFPTMVSSLNLPVKIINGKAFYYYTVDKKDRFYKLAEKLDVKRADILKYNPQAADGIQPGMVLTFPVELDAKVVDGYYTTAYTPGKDETIYGVAKRFDIPVDRIIEFNPEAESGVYDLVLTIPLIKAAESGDSGDPSDDGLVGPFRNYTIAKGETLSRIARENGITLSQLLKANPGLNVDHYQAGTIIRLPMSASLVESEQRLAQKAGLVALGEPEENNSDDSADELIPAEPERVTVVTVESGITPVAGESADTIPAQFDDTIEPADTVTVAVMLPFMLDTEPQSKTTQLLTEFYRGFLLGAETLSHEGSPVVIKAFDTASSVDTVRSVLSRMDDVDIIVAPDNPETLSLIAGDAARREAFVLNTFAVKDESYKSIPSMIQGNIPHEVMYAKAIDAFIDNFSGRIPVFISRMDGNADKAEFTSLLRQRLESEGIPFKEIPYRNFLGHDNLQTLPIDSGYVFVPVSGSRIEFNKFAPALKNFRETLVDPSEFTLFGYPEWIMFRNDQLDHLHSLNAVIYSRFADVESSGEAKRIADSYKEAFNLDMMDAVPNQGILGYDTAIFLINSLRGNGGDFNDSSSDYDGVQTGFSLVKPDNVAGLVNHNLYFISFVPGGEVIKTRL